MMNRATFVLSTGRCGTQWLAENLGAAYGDDVRVTHEPLHDGYHSRRMLGCHTPSDLGAEHARPILDHVEDIERTLEARPYIECGHPCWSTLPYLVERLGDRAQVVHLTRHPVPTAFSWLTMSAYLPPFLPHLREKVLLSPFDEGVIHVEYRDRWTSMSAFEKCLFYWAEVHGLALRLEAEARVGWLRVSFEDLFFGPGLAQVLGFLALPGRSSIRHALRSVVDAHRFAFAGGTADSRPLDPHPAIRDLARRLGYDPSSVDVDEMAVRYGQGRS